MEQKSRKSEPVRLSRAGSDSFVPSTVQSASVGECPAVAAVPRRFAAAFHIVIGHHPPVLSRQYGGVRFMVPPCSVTAVLSDVCEGI
jgi:hypothetical protein